MAMGPNPNRTPSEFIPIPTKIKPKMGGAPIPQNGIPLVLTTTAIWRKAFCGSLGDPGIPPVDPGRINAPAEEEVERTWVTTSVMTSIKEVLMMMRSNIFLGNFEQVETFWVQLEQVETFSGPRSQPNKCLPRNS